MYVLSEMFRRSFAAGWFFFGGWGRRKRGAEVHIGDVRGPRRIVC